jgi:hypothetical protein
LLCRGESLPESARLVPTDASILPNGYFILLWGLFLNTKNPTHPPLPHIEGVVASVYKHCSITANPIFKKQDRNTHITIPHPLKILKNFQGTMSNVGHSIIKKCPDLVSRGKRWQLETIKEKQ